MSHVKIGERYGAAQGSSKIITRAAPVAVPDRGIAVESGLHSHGEYVIQVRPPAPPPEPQRSWVTEDDEESQLEPQLTRVVSRDTE